MKTTLCAGAIAVLAIGCGSSWKETVETKVATQAAFDLKCDTKKIQIQQIDEEGIPMGHMYTYGARGCGNQATYKATCAGMGVGCTVANEAQAANK